MLLQDSLCHYSDKLREAYATSLGGQPEDQLKGPVAEFIQTAADKIGLTAQTQTETHTDEGRPDIGVGVNKLLCGHIELKAPGVGANPTRFKDKHSKEQWEKFKALPNLIYTDGTEWALYRSGNV